jgi:hypothetical protein
MKAKVLFIILNFLIVISLYSSMEKKQAQWKGSIKETDGVMVIQNPEEPIYGEGAVSIEEALSIGTAEGDPNYMFSEVRDMTVDDEGNIYVLDFKEPFVRKYTSEGKFIKIIGKKGQGPGEIGMPFFMSISRNNELIVEDPMSRRLVLFSLDGDWIKNISFARMSITQVEIDSEGNIIGNILDMEKRAFEVSKVSPEMDIICSYGSIPVSRNPSLNNPYSPMMRWALFQDGNIICGDPKEYELLLRKPGGEVVKKFRKSYAPVKIPEEEIKMLEKKSQPGREFEVPKYFPAFFWITVDDKDRIFVRTYEKKPGKSEYKNDIFSKDGKYMASIYIPATPHIIKKNMVYTIEEDEAGFHLIKKYKLTWNI